MKKQRFVLTPAFCDGCKRYGFKLIDAEGELSETGVFHSQEVGINSATQFFIQKISSDSEEMKEADDVNYFKLHIERIFEIYHEIFLLPLPLVDSANKSFQELLEISQQMITLVKNLVDIKKNTFYGYKMLSQKSFFMFLKKLKQKRVLGFY